MEIRANSNIYISTDIHSLFQKKNKPTTFSQCRTWTAFIDNVANSFLSYLRWKWNPVDQNPFCDALSRWGIWVKTTVGDTEQRHMDVCVCLWTPGLGVSSDRTVPWSEWAWLPPSSLPAAGTTSLILQHYGREKDEKSQQPLISLHSFPSFLCCFFFFFSQNKQTEIKTIPIIFPPRFGIATLLHWLGVLTNKVFPFRRDRWEMCFWQFSCRLKPTELGNVSQWGFSAVKSSVWKGTVDGLSRLWPGSL